MARIYQTATMGQAHLRVSIVSDQGLADLLVCRVGSWGLAQGDALWFITRNQQQANCWLYFTSIGMAQVRVCFVHTIGEAGWIDRGQAALRYRGRFG